ncbi:MAG TPA: ABC transporter permease [bacterium]|nr:ABC transporter permease [bacterium]
MPSRLVNRVRRVRPVAVKEVRQMLRDRRTLAVLLGFPIFMMLLFGYALNFDVKHIPLAVLDNDHTSRSRDFAQSFLHSGYFDLSRYLSSERGVDEVLDGGLAQVVLVVPAGFADSLARGSNVAVQLAVDGSNSNTASTVIGYSGAIMQAYSEQLTTAALVRIGRTNLALPIDYRPRVWYNPELNSASFLIPGIIVQILLLMTVTSTSLSVVREKERGTMEQLVVSPLHPLQVILGKSVPYIVLSLIGATVIVLCGWLLFGVAVKGSWLLLFLATGLFLAGGLGMGLLISTIAGTQRMAYQFSGLLTMLPSFLLSGWIFPLRNMPIPVQVVSYIIPARYFLPILRAIIIKGVGLSTFWPQMVFLLVFAVATISLSTARLRRQMS